jgi:hypothetical protein
MERVIHLAKYAVEQLERQNTMSSLHGTRSKATAMVIPQASRTPGGHHRQQQLSQQNQRNQEDQEVASNHRPRGGQPPANQAPRPQPNRNNNNRDEVADSTMDAWNIINARRKAHLADNSDRFLALSSVFDNVEFPKDFKPTNIQKYNGKQDPAQWLHLYSTAVSVAGGDTNTKVYFPMALEPTPLTWLESLTRESCKPTGQRHCTLLI